MLHSNDENRQLWQQFFEDFSYKPNWEFKFLDQTGLDVGRDICKVVMIMRVPDSRHPVPEATALDNLMGRRVVIPLIPITKNVFLREYFSDDHARDYILSYIQIMENHEINEWFRHRGVLCFDPHKD